MNGMRGGAEAGRRFLIARRYRITRTTEIPIVLRGEVRIFN